jgi:hypothetical protein
VSYTYTNILAKQEYDGGEIKIRGLIRLYNSEANPNSLEKVQTEKIDFENESISIEGIGQIKVKLKNSTTVYIGSWKKNEMLVEQLLSDNIFISYGQVIFRGYSYTLCSRDEIVTEVPITLGKFRINLPVVPQIEPTLELFDGTLFSIDINDSKPNDQFKITKNISVNSLIHRSIQADDEELYESAIVINKEKVIFTRSNLGKYANKSLNFRYVYDLRETPIDFLEKRYLRLPRGIKNISEILGSLSQITVAIEN